MQACAGAAAARVCHLPISPLSSSSSSFAAARTSQRRLHHRVSWRFRSSSSRLRFKSLRCQKMHVPGFGEASPEAKAANNLHNFFTYVAVKIVLAQLESYNPEAYKELTEFANKNSLNDGDKFVASLLRESPRHKGLALRILEVRSAYCKGDFEWDNLKRLSFKQVDESNTRIMRDYVRETSHMNTENKEI